MRGSYEWEVIWIALLVVAIAIIIVLSVYMAKATANQTSPFSFFSSIFG